MANILQKFAKNKPLFWGSIAAVGIGGILYFRHQAAKSQTASSDTGATTDPNQNIDPTTGFPYGSPEDQAALAQMNSGAFAGDPFGGGSFGAPGLPPEPSPSPTPAPVQTREEWIVAAMDVVPGGHSAEVRKALVDVLSGLTVTSAERRIFLEAVGVLGEPPGGYPKPIKVKDTPGHPGDGKVVVPNVIGKLYPEAAQIITKAGLKPHHGGKAVGRIKSESPHAGTHVQKESTVTLSS